MRKGYHRQIVIASMVPGDALYSLRTRLISTVIGRDRVIFERHSCLVQTYSKETASTCLSIFSDLGTVTTVVLTCFPEFQAAPEVGRPSVGAKTP